MTMRVLASEAESTGGEQAPLGELHAPEEEARPAKVINRPDMPTQAEIDRHRIDHVPYRSWCPECVEAFGRERAHRRTDSEHRSIPLFSCDYMYLCRNGVFARDELPEQERDGAIRILVGKCSKAQCIFAQYWKQVL